jgi:drug/metabolite transporter (DMT)-like permease
MVLVLVGVVLLTRVYDSAAVEPLGAAAGLLSGLSYTMFIFGLKYAAPHGSPQAILAIAFTVPVIVLLLPANAGEIFSAVGSSSRLLFAALGILGAGLSFIFYVVGLRQTAPAVASILAMVEPVTASLFGVLILNESLIGTQIIGMIMILVTVTALSVASGYTKRRS